MGFFFVKAQVVKYLLLYITLFERYELAAPFIIFVIFFTFINLCLKENVNF